MDVCAGADPRKNSFLLRQSSRHNERILVRNGDDFVDNIQMEIVRNKARPCSLDFVRTRFQRLALQGLQNHRRILRLNGDRFKIWFALFDDFGDSGDCAPGSYSGDNNINFAVGVGPDLFRCGLLMNCGVCGVVELLRHPGVRSRFRIILPLLRSRLSYPRTRA